MEWSPGECRARLRRIVVEAAARASRALPGQALAAAPRHGGVEFAGLRDYSPGDNPRLIDWRASLRRLDPTGAPRLVVRETLPEERAGLLLYTGLPPSTAFHDKLQAIVYAATVVLETAKRLGDTAALLVAHPHRGLQALTGDPRLLAHTLPRLACNPPPSPWSEEWPPGPGEAARRTHWPQGTRVYAAVTDYSYPPHEHREQAVHARARGAEPLAILATTPWEHRAPPALEKALVAPPKAGPLQLGHLLAKVEAHIAKTQAVLDAARAHWTSIEGLPGARHQTHRITALYTAARRHAIAQPRPYMA